MYTRRRRVIWRQTNKKRYQETKEKSWKNKQTSCLFSSSLPPPQTPPGLQVTCKGEGTHDEACRSASFRAKCVFVVCWAWRVQRKNLGVYITAELAHLALRRFVSKPALILRAQVTRDALLLLQLLCYEMERKRVCAILERICYENLLKQHQLPQFEV